MRAILLCFFGILSMGFVVSTSAKTQPLKSSDQNRPIIVKSSMPEVTVTFASDRTTGYAWFLLSYDINLVEPLRHKYSAPQNKIAGASGTSTWTFRIRESAFTVPQVTKITMVYRRPWETTIARTKVVTIITQ